MKTGKIGWNLFWGWPFVYRKITVLFTNKAICNSPLQLNWAKVAKGRFQGGLGPLCWAGKELILWIRNTQGQEFSHGISTKVQLFRDYLREIIGSKRPGGFFKTFFWANRTAINRGGMLPLNLPLSKGNERGLFDL